MSGPPLPRLLGLTATVVGLAAAVAITGEPRGTVERPLVAPGLVAADVVRVTVTRADTPPIVVELDDGGARVTAPVPGPADEAVVRDLISAVVTARADRVTGGAAARRAAGLDAPALRVRLDRRGGAPIEVARGAAVAASGQVWLGAGTRALLTPAWVGEALDRDLRALRRRRPFAPVAVGAMTGVELHGDGVDVVLAGQPLRRRDDGAGVRVAAAAVAALDAALAAVVLDVLVAGELGTPRLTVRVLGGTATAELAVHGPCPGHPAHDLVDGSAGLGCVPRAAVDAVVAAGRTLAGDDGVLRAPLEGAVTAIAADGTTLARRGAGWELTRAGVADAADDDAVAAFLAALADGGALGLPPAGPPDARWTVRLAGGAEEAWAWWWRADGGGVLVRDAERRALILTPRSAAAARSFGPRLRDRTALALEPTAIAAITATGVAPARLGRGALVGDWTALAPAGAVVDAAAVTALVDAAATLRGEAWLGDDELGRVRRTVTLSVDAAPVAGATGTAHTLAIGAARADGGCAVRVDGQPPLALPAATCAALLAPLVRR